ncbi:MAG: glycosyltransferase family 4 protein [Draconibacterium sp.]
MPFLRSRFEAYVLGYGINEQKISFVEVLKLVSKRQRFVLHCHRNNEMLFALLLRFLGGNFLLLFTKHADNIPSFITRFLQKKADVVVALTKRMTNTISRDSVVVGHGVNQNVFFPGQALHLPGIRQKKLILCAGRVREAKGQRLLVEALAPLIQNFPDWALLIVGKVDNPKFLKELQKTVTGNLAGDQVYFVNETNNIVNYYRAAHTVVVPSYTEGFSLVCAEAMSCGCNVVATDDVGIHSELISNEKTGYLFEAGNKHQLQTILTELMEGQLAHLGENARKEIAQNWSAKAEADRLAELYR